MPSLHSEKSPAQQLGLSREAYNHYADHMNAIIKAHGDDGGLSEEEHDRHTVEYNARFGAKIPMLKEYLELVGG